MVYALSRQKRVWYCLSCFYFNKLTCFSWYCPYSSPYPGDSMMTSFLLLWLSAVQNHILQNLQAAFCSPSYLLTSYVCLVLDFICFCMSYIIGIAVQDHLFHLWLIKRCFGKISQETGREPIYSGGFLSVLWHLNSMF